MNQSAALHRLSRYVTVPPSDPETWPDTASRLIAFGATAIEFNLPPGNRERIACVKPLTDALTRCRSNDVWLVISNDPIVCLAIDANALCIYAACPGDVAAARTILPPHIRVGVSAADLPLFRENEAQPDFAVIVPDTRPSEPLSPFPIACAETMDHFITSRMALPEKPVHRPWSDEFSLIKNLLNTAASVSGPHPLLPVPAGDDAAMLTALPRPVITTDTQRAQIHFRNDWQTFEEIGFKAVVVTLSDLAASYADTVALFINLGLPRNMSDAQAERLYQGLTRAMETYDCRLGGGNISASPTLSLDLFAIGNGRCDQPPNRGNAREGEGVYATGPIGLARAGLLCLERDITGFHELITAFKTPKARFDAAKKLEAAGVTCVMDISDGLAGDATHMAQASDLTIDLNIRESDIPQELTKFSETFSINALEIMITGGEDYQLLFTCRPEIFDRLKKDLPEAIRVGTCIPFNGTSITGIFVGTCSWNHGR